MKRSAAWFLLAAVGLAATASLLAQAPKAAPKRVALLVGINSKDYQKRGFGELLWAENDVDELNTELRRLGFDKVVVMKGSAEGALLPTRDNIQTQLDRLLVGVTKNDIVLVTLCGHGQQLTVKQSDGTTRDDGFYCPVEAVLNDPQTMVSLSHLTDEVLNKRGGKNLLLVDACRDGVIDRNRGGRTRGIQGRSVSLPEDTAILFSCRAGQKAEEQDKLKHGVFTYSVIETLRASAAANVAPTWSALVDGVQNRVAELTADQEPIAFGPVGRLILGRVSPGGGGRADEGTRPGEERDDNDLKMKLCWCPKGSFTMGSPATEPERDKDEGPVSVTLSRGFWMGKFEVTQDEWRRVMGTTIAEQRDKAGRTNLYGEGPTHPVYYVDHTEAEEFCRKFTEGERRAGRLPTGWEYRLPTEAQWEYACRAGTKTATAFGNQLSSVDANFDGNVPYNGAAKGPYIEKTTSVGHYRPNAWGLFDMHGNVWEWCRDGYAEQLAGGTDPPGAPLTAAATTLTDAEQLAGGTDPPGPSAASSRVIRGGCWASSGRFCRAADRYGFAPGSRRGNLGFRVARVSSQ